MRTVICVTPGCENMSLPIEIPDDGSAVLCGACEEWIIPPTEEEVAQPEQLPIEVETMASHAGRLA